MNARHVAWDPVPGPAGRLYESARWLPDIGVFQWVDILSASLHRWAPGDAEVEVRTLDLEFATVAIPIDHDRSLVASRSSLHEYSWSHGSLATLGRWRFDRDVRFNDGGMSPTGELYIGTMSMERRTDAGSLFKFTDGNLKEVISGIGISNGLGWAASNRALYIDSLVPRVHLLDLESPSPVLSTFADLDATEEPDGLFIGPDGDVLIASWGAGKLLHLAADGARRGDVPVPARFPTSVVLGGKGGRTVLVTTASAEEGKQLSELDGMVLIAEWPEESK